MNNKLIIIQEMLLEEMGKLTNDFADENEIDCEVARSNALSNTATTYLKSINANLRIKEIAEKENRTINSINKELGIENEKK